MALRAICKFTDWADQARIAYGQKRNFGPCTVLAWTDESVNCILPENTCFFGYYTESSDLKEQSLFQYISKLFYLPTHVKCQRSLPFKQISFIVQ